MAAKQGCSFDQQRRFRNHRRLSWSLSLNLLLAGTAAWLLMTSPAASPIRFIRPPDAAADVSASSNASNAALFESASLTNRFHWSRIESSSYEEYIANLRSIGCPEQTIRDILVADIEANYEQQALAVRRKIPFWTVGTQRREAARWEIDERFRLHVEKEELVRSLLGIAWWGKMSLIQDMMISEQALVRFMAGRMPEDRLEGLMFHIAKFQSQRDHFKARLGGVLTEEDRLVIKRMYEQFDAQWKEGLTAAQYEELLARNWALMFFQQDFELTPTEARQIALAFVPGSNSHPFWQQTESVTDEEQRSHEARFTNEVAHILGPSRFEHFQRMQDHQFRSIYSLVKANGLPRDAANTVYDVRQLYDDEMAHLGNDGSLDASARRERVEQMQAETREAISRVLGSKAFQEYLSGPGSWVTNLTQL